MPDQTKLELGPVQIEMAPPGEALQNMGFTMGGITMTIDSPTVDLVADQFGEIPLKKVLVGRNVSVTIPFAETNLQRMSAIIPLVSISVSGAFERVDINTPVGADLLASAAQVMRLTKSIGAGASSDPNDVFTFYNVIVAGETEVNFAIDAQRVWQVEAACLPDASNGYNIGVMGDIAI